jgi:hypothetical protein
MPDGEISSSGKKGKIDVVTWSHCPEEVQALHSENEWTRTSFFYPMLG